MVEQKNNNSYIISPLKMIGIVMITGISFGIIMSIVSNAFVSGVEYLFNARFKLDFMRVILFGKEVSFFPLSTLLVAVLIILIIRRLFSIERWHGPADSIYAAHRTDNELNLKAGFGSTIAAFVSAGSGAS